MTEVGEHPYPSASPLYHLGLEPDSCNEGLIRQHPLIVMYWECCGIRVSSFVLIGGDNYKVGEVADLIIAIAQANDHAR